MNELGLGLVDLALQTTLLTCVAIPLALLLARRNPAAGAHVPAVSLGLLLLLPAAALVPLPAWWAAAPAEANLA